MDGLERTRMISHSISSVGILGSDKESICREMDSIHFDFLVSSLPSTKEKSREKKTEKGLGVMLGKG